MANYKRKSAKRKGNGGARTRLKEVLDISKISGQKLYNANFGYGIWRFSKTVRVK